MCYNCLCYIQGCPFYLYTVTFSVTSGHSGLCRLYCLATSRASMLNPGKRWSPSLKILLRSPNAFLKHKRHKKKPNMIWSTLQWLWQLHFPEDFGATTNQAGRSLWLAFSFSWLAFHLTGVFCSWCWSVWSFNSKRGWKSELIGKSFVGSYSSRRLLISKWSTMWKNIKLNQRKTKVLTKNKTKQKFTFPFSHRSCLVH